MKKKVFRIWKWVEVMHNFGLDNEIKSSLVSGWPMDADGLTKEELTETNLIVFNDWLVEEDAK